MFEEMVVLLVDYTFGPRKLWMITEKCDKSVKDLISGENNEENVFITCNGRISEKSEPVQDGQVYHIIPRLPGGKGGFGSMLRAIGAQIDKTNNREACRDLSGRRMRDVNNEKQLKEWLAKKAEKDKEKEEKRRERIERRRAMPNHKFEDPLYEKQRVQVAENLQDAFNTGLMRAQTKQKPSCTVTSETAGPSGASFAAGCSSSVAKKRKTDSSDGPSVKVKKQTEWLGIDIDNLSDLDSEEDDSVEGATVQPDVMSSEDSCGSDTSDELVANGDNVDVCDTESSGNNRDGVDQQTDIKVSSERTAVSSSDQEKSGVPSNSKDSVNQEEKEHEDTTDCVQSEINTNGVCSNLKDLISQSKVGDEKIQDGAVPQETPPQQDSKPNDSDSVNLEDYNSAQELEALGLDKLKMVLLEKGMKCGGTLQQRAERLFSVKGLSPDQISPTLLAKPQNGKGNKKK